MRRGVIMANILTTMRKSGPLPEPPTQPTRPPPPPVMADRARETAPAATPRPNGEAPLGQPQTATRTLVVGREIVLSGEISACDRLVVEGTVKANIKDCRDIAISEGGLFTGSASVESAEIRGRFEGELTVSGRLLIRAPGQVSAAVRYGEIEIERGGRLSGHVDATDASKPRS
jgi:cytoskeletal protein CcmA (bactofilin family)